MEYLQSTLLKKIPDLKHGFFCPGTDGSKIDNFSFKNGPKERVLQAREKACGMIDVNAESLTHVYQEHGNTMYIVNQEHLGMGAKNGEGQVGKGDALITAEPGVPLAILIADCLPIFLTTPNAEVIALVHAGWRGSLNSIGRLTALKIMKEYGIKAHDLYVWIGPGISKENFEVGEEVLEQFDKNWACYGHALDHKNRKIDLKQFNKDHLLDIGILPEHIEVSSECTFADKRFFSYRRDGAGIGHNLAVIEKSI